MPSAASNIVILSVGRDASRLSVRKPGLRPLRFFKLWMNRPAAVAAETRLPVSITQYCQRMAALIQIVLRGEHPAQSGVHAEHREVVAGHEFAQDQFRLPLEVETEQRPVAAEHALEG